MGKKSRISQGIKINISRREEENEEGSSIFSADGRETGKTKLLLLLLLHQHQFIDLPAGKERERIVVTPENNFDEKGRLLLFVCGCIRRVGLASHF